MMTSAIISLTVREVQNKSSAITIPVIKTLQEYRPSDRQHPYGGTLVWGSANKPMMINPVLTQSSISAALMGLIFDSLVRIDAQGNIVSGLAESWDISSDGLVYTFHLRKGVFFHDGAELTAEDVKWTYDLIRNPDVGSVYRSHFEMVDKFEAPDRYTFRVILKQPFSSLISKMVRYIVPKHLLKNENIKTASFNDHPVGTGSFQFYQWNKETNIIELKANDHYFEGRPYLNRIIVKTYANNSQLLAAMMRQEVDLVQWLTKEDYSVINQNLDFRAYAVYGKIFYAILYDLDDPIWHDIQLRYAVAHGINKQEVINALPNFGGEECVGPFHPKSIGYNADVKALEYDPVKARMILMHRGWEDATQDTGGEGGIRKKGGQELELKMLVDERNDIHKTIAMMIRQQLSEIGIKVSILFYQNEKEITPDFLAQYKPQAWLRLFSGSNLSEGYEAALNWYSQSSGFGIIWRYRNEEVDRFFESARMASDQKTQADIYKKICKIVYQDQPACFLFYPAGYFAVNAKFKNTEEYFTLHMPTYTIKDWYIEDQE